jgi:hypothetical protein
MQILNNGTGEGHGDRNSRRNTYKYIISMLNREVMKWAVNSVYNVRNGCSIEGV